MSIRSLEKKREGVCTNLEHGTQMCTKTESARRRMSLELSWMLFLDLQHGSESTFGIRARAVISFMSYQEKTLKNPPSAHGYHHRVFTLLEHDFAILSSLVFGLSYMP